MTNDAAIILLSVAIAVLLLVAYRCCQLQREVQKSRLALRRSEEERVDREIEFRQILDALDDLVLVKGPKSKIVWANRAFREYYGMSNEELAGIVDAPFNEPDYTMQYVQDDKWVFENARSLDRAKEPVNRHDGVLRYFHTVKSPIFDKAGKVIMTVGISRDISEQENLINQLRESEERLRMAIEAGKIGTWDLNLTLGTALWSPRMYEIYGLPLGTVILHSQFLNLVHPEDRGTVEASINDWFTTSHTCFLEFRILRPQGEVRWLYCCAKPIANHDNAIVRVVGVAMDVTERREALETITAQQAQMASSAKMAALGEMAGGIAHEINNPLAVIEGRARQIKSLVMKDTIAQDKLVAFADTISLTCERIAKIIRGLRTFSRSAENDPYVLVDIQVTLDDTVSFCTEQFNKHRVPLIVPALSAPMTVQCRAVEISQALLNLLSNGLDAVRGQTKPWVRVDVTTEDDHISIAVTDSGAGISPTIRAKMHQPFFTTKEVGKGTGLGLSITKSIVERHGGEFFYDENSANTRFVIKLPRLQSTVPNVAVE